MRKQIFFLGAEVPTWDFRAIGISKSPNSFKKYEFRKNNIIAISGVDFRNNFDFETTIVTCMKIEG
jgi:hypothetical protein